jgi:Myo-inositol oxygenase
MRWRTGRSRAERRFRRSARAIHRAHAAQTHESVAALARKYAEPVFGRVESWSLVERLANCVDPTDVALGACNQQVHVLQVFEAMERDGVKDDELRTAALLHDLGKLLLLTGEPPENVVCYTDPIGSWAPGVGLENCVLQWNHDEFGYSRFKDHVPEPVAWLIRYHSIRVEVCAPLMDERDRAYTERYLKPFQRYDQDSKSARYVPARPIAAYRDLLEAALPRNILF